MPSGAHVIGHAVTLSRRVEAHDIGCCTDTAGDHNRRRGTPLQSHLTQYSQYGTYRAVSDLLASRHDPLARADGVAHAAPVVRVLMMVLWLGLG